MARRPGQPVTAAHYPRLRLMRGLVRAPAPTFLIGSGHLGGRMAFYLQGQPSSPASTEPSLDLPGASVLVLAPLFNNGDRALQMSPLYKPAQGSAVPVV